MSQTQASGWPPFPLDQAVLATHSEAGQSWGLAALIAVVLLVTLETVTYSLYHSSRIAEPLAATIAILGEFAIAGAVVIAIRIGGVPWRSSP